MYIALDLAGNQQLKAWGIGEECFIWMSNVPIFLQQFSDAMCNLQGTPRGLIGPTWQALKSKKSFVNVRASDGELDVSYVEAFHNLWLTLNSKYATWSMVRVINEHCFTMVHLVTGTVGTDSPHICLDLTLVECSDLAKPVLFWWGDNDLTSKVNS